jgi:hypothetical protein
VWQQSPTASLYCCRLSPLLDGSYDGITVMPLEVLFVKAKTHLMASHTASSLAHSYQSWLQVSLHPDAWHCCGGCC